MRPPPPPLLWPTYIGEHIENLGNILGTWLELIGNLKGTCWEQRKNEKNPLQVGVNLNCRVAKMSSHFDQIFSQSVVVFVTNNFLSDQTPSKFSFTIHQFCWNILVMDSFQIEQKPVTKIKEFAYFISFTTQISTNPSIDFMKRKFYCAIELQMCTVLCLHPTAQGQVIDLLQIWLSNACFVQGEHVATFYLCKALGKTSKCIPKEPNIQEHIS